MLWQSFQNSVKISNTFTFKFIHLADAFIQRDLQLRNTTSDST